MNITKSHPKCQYAKVLKDDSEKKYYILGLLAADGWISKKSNRCELTLKEADVNYLEMIKNLIVPQKKLKYKQKQGAYRLTIDSAEFVETVYKYFSGDKKSQTLTFPPNIPNKYIRHFVRGYVDGDGNIDTTKRYKRVNSKLVESGASVRLRILGTNSFLLGLNQSLISEGITNFTLKPQKKGTENVRYLCWIGSSADRILQWIYDDTRLYLPRKKAVYNMIKHLDSSALLENIKTNNADYNTQMSAKFADKDIVDSIVYTI